MLWYDNAQRDFNKAPFKVKTDLPPFGRNISPGMYKLIVRFDGKCND